MQLWLAKNSEVPLREQLTTQVMLAILSHDLKPGQKLPSTRELARRFRIHANTVSAAYRDLAERGWVEFEPGSGVYVRAFTANHSLDAQLDLDQVITEFLRVARQKGFSLAEIQARIRLWLEIQPPDHFLIIEPDADLREILIAEIHQATGLRVAGASLEECAKPELLAGAAPVAMYGLADKARAALPPNKYCLLLRSRSVKEALPEEKPPAPDALVTVVSHWPDFLRWARAVLVALRVDPDALSFRSARERGWQKGLRSSALVITDTLTAGQLPDGCRARVFRVIADSSIAELRHYVTNYLNRPIPPTI